VLNSLAYTYGVGTNRIAQVTRTFGNTVAYGYDGVGQLTAAVGKEYGGTTNRADEQFGYGYDGAGNLSSRTNNGLVQNFAVNTLNQLSNITRSNRMTVAGTVWGAATNVTVNTTNASRYADNSFAAYGFVLTDGTNTFTAIAKDSLGRGDTNVVKAYLPATVTNRYDLNGNLRTNGTRWFEYDDENQLIRITEANVWKSDFTYDGKMRRRERQESVWDGSKWVTNLLVR
jgi:YD repeat-containing protein